MLLPIPSLSPVSTASTHERQRFNTRFDGPVNSADPYGPQVAYPGLSPTDNGDFKEILPGILGVFALAKLRLGPGMQYSELA